MSQPRAIVPGATYLVTRRILRRHFLFRPDTAITQLLVYSLAVSARRYGVQVHALCAMSTHLHLVVTDVQGVLPRFLQFFHRIVALGTKVLRAWEGPVWDHEAASVVRLWTRTSIVEMVAYTLANPVAAGLVRRASEWPGAKVHVDDIGSGVLQATRPSVYFDPKNPGWPSEMTLPLTVPPSIGLKGEEGVFREEVSIELGRLQAQAQMEMQQQGRPFLGVERLLAVSPYDRATSLEALRARNPTFAVGHSQGGAWHKAVAVLRTFRASYRKALEQWCTGLRSVVFPAGTWWMRVFHGAPVSDIVVVV